MAEPKWFISSERLADFQWKASKARSLSSVSGLFGGTEKVAKAGRELIAGSGELKYHIGSNELKRVTYNSSVEYARVMGQYGTRSFKKDDGSDWSFIYSFIKLSACRLEKAHSVASESSLCSVRKRELACFRDPGFYETSMIASAHNKKHNTKVANDWTGFSEARTRLQRACTQDELNDVAMHAQHANVHQNLVKTL